MAAAMSVREALSRLAIDPHALSAAGVEPGHVRPLIDRARAALADRSTQLTAAVQQQQQARRQHLSLAPRVAAGGATAGEVALFAQLGGRLEQLDTAVEGLLQEVRDAATDGLAPASAGTLEAYRRNSGWEVDEHFRVADRSQEAWVALRAALASERSAQREGRPTPEAAGGVIAAALADPAVALARARLASDLGPVTAAWEAALGAAE